MATELLINTRQGGTTYFTNTNYCYINKNGIFGKLEALKSKHLCDLFEKSFDVHTRNKQ